MQSAWVLVYPMAALVGFTLLFSCVMLFTRINEVRRGRMSARYFKTFTEGTPTPIVVKLSRHYNNLFELPVIYYATLLMMMILGITSSAAVGFAWLFVAARVAHAYIHVGSNKIVPRIFAFVLGWVAILGLWFQVLGYAS
ncbi:MAG: MAPEG family protein [Bacteriovoracia bacterium]